MQPSSTSTIAPPRHRLAAVAAASALVAGIALLVAPSGGTATGEPTVGPERPLTAANQIVAPANNSPTLVEDPTDDRFVVLANRVDAPDFSCALQVSGDGGLGWAPVRPISELPAGAEKCYAPEVAFDRQGVLYYLFVGLAGTGNQPMGAFITTSKDRGRTFTPPRQVLGPLSFGVRMAFDLDQGRFGRMHLTWIKALSPPASGGFAPPPNPIMAMHSDDRGKSFSDPVQVSDPARERVVAPAMAVGGDGAIHIAYYDLQDDAVDYQGLEGPVWDGEWTLVVATSTDGGLTFGRQEVVEPAVVPPERVILILTMTPPALVAQGKRLCLSWSDGRTGDADILARCSSNGGSQWSDPVRLNDDARGNGVSQFMPRLGLAPGGRRLDAVFYDRRVVGGNFVNDVFLTYSLDGGRKWAPNVRLTANGSDSRIGQQYAIASAEGLFEFGSRMGLLSTEDSAIAAWADTRNSPPMTPAQDVFSTVVKLPTAGSRNPLRLAAGIAALVIGLGLLGWIVARRRPERASAVSVGAMLMAMLVGGGCAAKDDGGASYLPASSPVVTVAMKDHSFDHPDAIPSGRVVFEFRNLGSTTHRATLLPLPDDLPPIDEQLRGDDRRAIDPLAAIYERRPGRTGTFAVDLVRGQRYAFVCFVVGEDGISHARKGMSSEFRAS